MLNKYKNEFVNIIRKHGFDPTDFGTSNEELSLPSLIDSVNRVSPSTSATFPVSQFPRAGDAQKPNVFTIRFRDTGLKFVVVENISTLHTFGASYTRYDTGFPYLHNPGWQRSNYLPIETVYQLFNNWLSEEVKPYIDETMQPDLWQQIKQQKQLVSADLLTDYETSPFTEPEKQQLRASIKQFRILICESFDPTQNRLEVIDQKLDYLMAAADRPINRFDWKGIALSTVMSIAITLSLDTDRGRQLFELFKQAFAAVLHLLPGN